MHYDYVYRQSTVLVGEEDRNTVLTTFTYSSNKVFLLKGIGIGFFRNVILKKNKNWVFAIPILLVDIVLWCMVLRSMSKVLFKV